MPKKQVICMHVGQAGVQLGNAIWESFGIEHGIKVNGILASQHVKYGDDSSLLPFFCHLRNVRSRYAPRCLFVDTESMVMDEIRTGSYRDFFHPMSLISGIEDASNLFPRGYCTAGKHILCPTMDALRRIAEGSDNIHGIFLFRSFGGGTGSGAATLFLNEMQGEFSKTNVSEFGLIPAPCLSVSIVEAYNTVLTIFQTLRHINLSIILDNQALYDISKLNLGIQNPNYVHTNRIVSNIVSCVTSSLRFDSVLSSDFNIFQTNLIPYPQLKYPVVSYTPISSVGKQCNESQSIHELAEDVFQKRNFLVKCFPEYGEYMACAVLFRGKNCNAREITNAIARIKSNSSNKFVDWCPTGFKTGICHQPLPYIEYSCIRKVNRAVCLLANSTCISQIFDYLLQKFDLLYKTKAYVHWFTGEGLEEAELVQARQGVQNILMNYVQFVNECQK